MRAPASIKARADTIRSRIRQLQGNIGIEQARLAALRAECDHPNRYRTSCMGDPGTYCPDCGDST